MVSAQDRWNLDEELSFISYDANHFLHAWSGTNNKIKGVILGNNINNLEKIAIGMLVSDFDSKNSSRDNNALEILEVLKFPKIQFFSSEILKDEDDLIFNGELNFHGISIRKTIIAKVDINDDFFILTGSFKLFLS